MNKYWKFTEMPTGHFFAIATEKNSLCYPESRLYFSKEALECDFGKLDNQSIQQIDR